MGRAAPLGRPAAGGEAGSDGEAGGEGGAAEGADLRGGDDLEEESDGSGEDSYQGSPYVDGDGVWHQPTYEDLERWARVRDENVGRWRAAQARRAAARGDAAVANDVATRDLSVSQLVEDDVLPSCAVRLPDFDPDAAADAVTRREAEEADAERQRERQELLEREQQARFGEGPTSAHEQTGQETRQRPQLAAGGMVAGWRYSGATTKRVRVAEGDAVFWDEPPGPGKASGEGTALQDKTAAKPSPLEASDDDGHVGGTARSPAQGRLVEIQLPADAPRQIGTIVARTRGPPGLPADWWVEERQEARRVVKTFFSPAGKRFRSRTAAVAAAAEETPTL